MSELKKALHTIVSWLQQQPNLSSQLWGDRSRQDFLASCSNSGLSLSKIKELVTDLNLNVGEEFCQVYQLLNGTQYGASIWDCDGIFDINCFSQEFIGVGLLPLSSVVAEHQDKRDFYQEENYQSLNAVPYPLTHLSGLDLFVAQGIEGCMELKGNTLLSPIRIRSYKEGANKTLVMFSSLTAMFQTIAESYTTAYTWQEGYLTKELDRTKAIWRKYNGDFFVSNTLRRHSEVKDSLTYLEQDVSSGWIQELADVYTFTERKELLEALIGILLQPLLNANYYEKANFVKNQVAKSLIRIKPKSLLSLLASLANNQDDNVRYWAAIILSNLADYKAVSYLEKLKSDRNNCVSVAAQQGIARLRMHHSKNKVTGIDTASTLEALIEETNKLMKRGNITVEEGKNYLLHTFAKRSRLQLTNQELIEFRDYLLVRVDAVATF